MNKYEYEMLARNLLNFVRENFDLVEVCEKLLEWSFTHEQIMELGFNQHTIENAQQEIDKGLIE